MLIGRSGNTPTSGTIFGTVNQIGVAIGSGTIQLSTPQSIGTASSPSFAGLTLAGFNGVVTAATGILEAKTLTNGQMLIGNTGNAPAVGTIAGTTNRISVSVGAGTLQLSTPQDLHTSASVTFASVAATISTATQNSITTLGGVTSIAGGKISNGGTTLILGNGAGPTVSGSNNVVLGATAGALLTSGGNCTLVGCNAGHDMTGGQNTGVGSGALFSITSGQSNTAAGFQALGATLTGNDNAAFGKNAGNGFAHSRCVFVGSGADGNGGHTNAIAIGYNAITDGDNVAVIGDSSVSVLKSGSDNVCDLGSTSKRFKTGYFTGLQLGAGSGGTASTLSEFESNVAHNTTASGPWGSSQTCNISITKLGPLVSLVFPGISSSATILSNITIAAALPARFRPSTDKFQPFLVIDNNITIAGICQVTASTGVIVIQRALSETRITGSGLGGFSAQTVTFHV